MSDTDKRFQTFFDIWHDDQFVDQRVRRFSGDNRRLGHTNKTTVFVTLLRVSDRSTFHRRFHRSRTTAGADIQLTQAQLVSDATGIQVLIFVD